jgi:hypothetical protein
MQTLFALRITFWRGWKLNIYPVLLDKEICLPLFVTQKMIRNFQVGEYLYEMVYKYRTKGLVENVAKENVEN